MYKLTLYLFRKLLYNNKKGVKVNPMIFNPLEEYEQKFKNLHLDNAKKRLDDLVKVSGVDIAENKKTVKEYTELKEKLSKIKKKFNLWRFLRVIMIITLVLIPLVIMKVTPKIRAFRTKIEQVLEKTNELLALAKKQMAPINSLFTDRDGLNLIEETIPSLKFFPSFSFEQESDMIVNYDFYNENVLDQSTIESLSGKYNENPFLFEKKLTHKMGIEVYHGYKTITWTETYRGSDGKMHVRTRTQTLHASVTKPKPFYSTQVVLNYCAQGGPELSFSRDATHLEQKSDREIERYVKKGEKNLKRLTDKAISQNKNFMSMSNSDFEVLFDALDRTNEVQFRTLFTPLAQTNMVDLIRSQTGYGDDFNFIKRKRTNRISTHHSQGRPLTLSANSYFSHSFDEIEKNFLYKNAEFFRAVYFDFAPLWAIPIYQERPAHSLRPIPEYSQKYSCKEYESLSNIATSRLTHPSTKTNAILKASFVDSKNGADEITVTAYSYDIKKRVDFIPVFGGDGRMHSVPVPWDDYIPLEARNNCFVSISDGTKENIIAKRNNLCLYN